MHRAVSACLLVFAFSWCRLVLAREPARVVIVEGGDGALGNRVQAELSAAGLSIVSVSDRQDDPELARKYYADAVVRTTGEDSLRVWITNKNNGVPITEELTLRGDEGNSLALYAVERLRARFIEIGLLPESKSTPAVTASTTSVTAPTASRSAKPQVPALPGARATPSFAVEGGALGLAATGGLGTTVDGTLSASLRWRAWSVSVFGALPLTAMEVKRDVGAARGTVTLAGVRGTYSLREAWRLAPELGASLAVVDLSLQGLPAAGFDGREQVLIAGLSSLEAGCALRVTDALRLRFRLGGGATTPRPVVRFEQRDVASWGRWVATGGLALELDAGRLFAASPKERKP